MRFVGAEVTVLLEIHAHVPNGAPENTVRTVWATQGGAEAIRGPMSDRKTIATTMLIAGIMLGAFTVQLKDQLSLHLGTLGFEAIMKCSATGP